MKEILKIILLIILSIISAFLIFWSTCTVAIFIPTYNDLEGAMVLLIPAVIIFIPTILGIIFLVKSLKKKE